MNTQIRTSSGALFDPLNPAGQVIDIDVIAHALSQICRFTGHTRVFYSVAQHSTLVATLLAGRYSPRLGLYGLLHDASEAYIADVSRPVKHAPAMTPYRALESTLQRAIYAAFGLMEDEPLIVKDADAFVLDVEMRDLMVNADPVHRARAFDFPVLVPLSPEAARVEFLQAFHDLRHLEVA